MKAKSKANRSLHLRNYFFSYILTILIFSTTSISFIWWLHEINELDRRQRTLNTINLNKDKAFVRSETERAVRNINFIRSLLSKLPEDSVKRNILHEMENWRTQYGGYLFVNTYNGQALLYDGKIVKGYKNISDLTDPSGLRIFDIEKQASNNSEGVFMQYLFKKMDNEKPEPKISYIMSIPEWEWLVGTGIYRSDTQAEINQIKAGYYSEYKKELKFIILFFLLTVLISYIFVYWLNKKIIAEVNRLSYFFDHASQKDETIDEKTLRFTQFRQIGTELNKMIKKRVSLKKQLAEREERIQGIFDAAKNIAFIFTDLDESGMKILDFSPGAENIFNFERNDLINKKVSLLMNKKGIKRLGYIRDYTLRDKAGYRDEMVFIRKDGSEFTSLISVHPLLKDQAIVGTIMVLIDITKRKEAEKELIQYQANLEKIVDNRTIEVEQKNKELMEKNAELERFNDLFVGREFRIKELRERIKILEKEEKSN